MCEFCIPFNILALLMSALANQDWIGWTIGLIAVVLAVIFYFKSKATTRLAYQRSGRHLVGGRGADLPDDVSIYYKGTVVPLLSSSEIVFWNAGTSTVRGSDIVEVDPLRITLDENTRILRILITMVTRKVNLFAVTVDPDKGSEALCSFDYLDPGDGVRIEMLHTSETRHPIMRGTIRGLPGGVSEWGQIRSPSAERIPFWGKSLRVPRLWFQYVMTYGAFLFIILTAVARAIQSYLPKLAFWLPKHEISRSDQLAGSVVAAIYLITGAFPLWTKRRRFPKALSQDN
jgi:hypothetical protein